MTMRGNAETLLFSISLFALIALGVWVGQEAGLIDKPEPPSCGITPEGSRVSDAWIVLDNNTCLKQERYERMVVAALNDTERGLTVGELEDVTGLEMGLLRGPLNEVVYGLRDSGIVRVYDPCDPGLLGGTNCEPRILLNAKNYRTEVAP